MTALLMGLRFSTLAAVCSANPGSVRGPAPGRTAGYDFRISAADFARGSIRVVRGHGWADREPIIECAGHSPDWAEWDFTVAEPGVYRIFAKFAAAASRPLQLLIDGSPVSENVLGETTGDWRSSTARWFPAGIAVLGRGKHVLRIQRAGCIPHIVAFGFRRESNIDLGNGPLALPRSLWLRDGYRVQDWMIWTIGGIERFAVTDRTYRICDGRHRFNRPMYGDHGPETVFAGDRPALLFTRGPATKLGMLRFAVETGTGSKWLDQLPGACFAWNGAWAHWTIPAGAAGKNALDIRAVPLPDTPGVLVRLSSRAPITLRLWFGGIRGNYPDNRAGTGPMPFGDPDADCSGDRLSLQGAVAVISDPGVPGGTAAAAVAGPHRWAAVPAAGGAGKAAQVRLELAPGPILFAAVAAEPGVLRKIMAAAPAAWESACRHYERIADRLRTETPSAILDAAVRSNNTAMDGEYRPPSFLHGALRWGTECGGWYLGWRGWYGPITAGDFERVRAAAEMHLHHQFTRPETGLRSRGKIANFVAFSGKGEDTHTGYNMQEVFLDELRTYLHWTGDFPFLVRHWPQIRAADEYERREIGRGLDGLYTNAINTWISDGHHYNGCACTQASAYAVARNRFLAELARAAGKDPAPYEKRAEKTRREMNARLWMPAKGYFAEYLDRDGILHDAAEAPTIYHPIEMGAADPFQAYQMTRYVDERLWRFGDQILANDWFPVIVTNGLIGFNETLNTALAYYYAGRFERAWRLLHTCCESTAKAAVPGSISCYGSRRGEQGTYIDFTDASSLLARTVVEGLFGLRPRLDLGRVEWAPGFPAAWDHAELRTRGIQLAFRRHGRRYTYRIETERPLVHRLRVPLDGPRVQGFEIDNKTVRPRIQPGVGRPYLQIETPAGQTRTTVQFTVPVPLPRLRTPQGAARQDRIRLAAPTNVTMLELRDPQGMFAETAVSPREFSARIARDDGPHTAFLHLESGGTSWWAPLDIRCLPPLRVADAAIAAVRGVRGAGLHFELVNHSNGRLRGPARISAAGASWKTDLDLGPGARRRFDLPFPATAALLPGHTRIQVDFCGLRTSGTARLWRLFEAFPGRRKAFARACRLLDFPRNYALGRVFTRKYAAGEGPVLNNWTWYKPEVINADALRAHAAAGVLTTRVGVPFAVRVSGRDGLFLSRWRPFPAEAEVRVHARGDRLYLLLANHTHNSQTHMALAEVVLEYAGGRRTIVPLRAPHDIDGMLQHYSDMAPEWIGGADGGWYGHGRATGVHADVADIPVNPDLELRAFRLRCLARETLIGLLGATLHQPAARAAAAP